jgi:nitric oxide reductase large subunit
MQVQDIADVYLEHNVTPARVMLLMLVGMVGVGIYLLPSIVGRRKQNAGSIRRINLLLGWTVIGWIVAMFLAMKHEHGRSES